MPRSLSAKATIDLVLFTDQDIPENERPTFIFKALNVEEEEHLGRFYDEVDKDVLDVDNKLSDRINNFLQPYLRGYRNMGDWKFPDDTLNKILTAYEAYDLINQLLSSSRLTYEEKKRSEYRASSGEEYSAEAVKENASVTNTQE